mmetsp:Transcript_23818/g.29283  ORF Transcript_23818/g.29283 Transcript_23818/m.29283 type:complete len:93 (-) Transcript_23818:3047-3325(-)
MLSQETRENKVNAEVSWIQLLSITTCDGRTKKRAFEAGGQKTKLSPNPRININRSKLLSILNEMALDQERPYSVLGKVMLRTSSNITFFHWL